MADPKEVLKYLKLSVKVEENPDEEIRNHLRNTLLGTPGKLRYRHTSFDTKLPFLGRIYFLILRKSEKLLGSVAFSLRETMALQKSLDVWYIRYFSIHAPLRDSKYRRNRMKRSETKKQPARKKKPHGDSLLKNFSQPYFDEPDNLLRGDVSEKPKSLIYAYVERDNLQSWNFTETIGFETVGKICTTLFSRYNPKRHPNVQAIDDSEKDEHLLRLREFYKGYTLYTEQNIYYGDYYLVWKENGEILAGCQANPEVWELIDYPGSRMNQILMKYGTRLPVIRKIFDPGYQKFIAVEGIWYKEGCEKYLYYLWETACVLHGYRAAVIWLDSTSALVENIRSLGRLGIISKLLKPAEGDIRVKFNNYNEEEKQVYYRNPAYISCFDMT